MSAVPRGHTLMLVYMVHQNAYWLLWQFLPQAYKHLGPVFPEDTSLSSQCHFSGDFSSLIGSQKAVNVLSVQLLSCCKDGTHQIWFHDFRSHMYSIIVSHVKAKRPPFGSACIHPSGLCSQLHHTNYQTNHGQQTLMLAGARQYTHTVCLLWKTIWQFPKKLNTQLPWDPVIPFPNMYPGQLKACIHTKIYAWMSIAAWFEIAKLEVTQMSSHMGMACPCHGNTAQQPEGIEKEWTADTQKKNGKIPK